MTNEELTELREAFNAYTASEGCGCCGNEKRHDAARERMNAILWPKQPSQETPVEHPNEAFRWICVHCTAVNSNLVTTCDSCARERYPRLNRGVNDAR